MRFDLDQSCLWIYHRFFMALTKAQKQKIVSDLKEKIDRQKSIVFADFTGLKVKDLSALRRKMKAADGELKIAKKTLISLALKEKKFAVDLKKLQGEIALGFGYKDEISPFKIIYDFAKEKEGLKILGGLIAKDFYEKEKAIELAQLPTRDELLARLVGSISSPLSGLINVLQGNLKGLIYALSAIKK